MRRFFLLTCLTTSTILVFADAGGVFAQVRPNQNATKQERMQQQREQRMQQGEIPPNLRKQYPPVRQRPLGGLVGMEPANAANRPLSPQQREMRRQLIEALGLTPEQRFKISDIRKAH